jgi:hypothetical protein
VTWRLAPVIGLVVLLCPVMAKAQTNLDQGKSASQIFANACVECHKEPRGLAKGRSASALTDFLREHYTTNAQQAAQLAAYVLGGRSADTAPPATPSRTKPAPERALVEEPKPPRQGRTPGKPEERAARNPAGQAAKPAEQAGPSEQPTFMHPIVGPAATAHNRRKDQRLPAPTPSEPDTGGMQPPAAAAAEPAGSAEPSSREPSREPGPPAASTSTVPTETAPAPAAPAASGDNSAVPRDHIPD